MDCSMEMNKLKNSLIKFIIGVTAVSAIVIIGIIAITIFNSIIEIIIGTASDVPTLFDVVMPFLKYIIIVACIIFGIYGFYCLGDGIMITWFDRE